MKTALPRRFGRVFAVLVPLLLSALPLSAEDAAPQGVLSRADAVRAGLEGGNIQAALAAERVKEAEARKDLARSAFLPRVGLGAGVEDRTVNLRAMGIDFPGAPPVVGPFDTYWGTLQLSQKVFDLSDLRRFATSRRAIDLERMRLALAREQTTEIVATLFLECLRLKAQAESIQSDLELDRELLQMAEVEKEQGLATGIDVKRAATRLSLDASRLLSAQKRARDAKRALLKAAGLPVESNPELAGDLATASFPPLPEGADALSLARQERSDLAALRLLLEVQELEVGAIKGERPPSVQLSAAATSSGLALDDLDYSRGLRLEAGWSLFTGGARSARIRGARIRLAEAELDLRDQERTASLEVLSSQDEVGTARERLASAGEAFELAGDTLELARQRFTAGLADNLEVTSAQADLARAREERIEALYRLDLAGLRLLRATGQLKRAFPFL